MIKSTKLANEITVVTDSYPHIESAAVGVWIKAGSRNEQPSQHGISHVLEHMAFKGTKTRSAQDIATEIENVGGDINAATGHETTAYFARVLKKDISLAIDIFADILINSQFDGDELLREKHVILQELGAVNDNPEDLVFDNFQHRAFHNQPLGRSILGSQKSVNNIGKEDLFNYLTTHYQGRNMVVVVVGNVEHGQIVKQVGEKFQTISNKKTPTAIKAKYTGGEEKTKRDLQEAQILLGFEGRGFHVNEFYASQILAMLLGGGMSSRLFQEIREKHGLCYAIYAMHSAYNDTGLFSIYASTQKDDVAKLLKLIIVELKKACQKISKDELNRAREQIRAHLLMAQENPIARASQLARQILFFNRFISNNEIMERLNAIGIEKLEKLATKLFTSKNPTLVSMGPIENMLSEQDFLNEMSHDKI